MGTLRIALEYPRSQRQTGIWTLPAAEGSNHTARASSSAWALTDLPSWSRR